MKSDQSSCLWVYPSAVVGKTAVHIVIYDIADTTCPIDSPPSSFWRRDVLIARMGCRYRRNHRLWCDEIDFDDTVR